MAALAGEDRPDPSTLARRHAAHPVVTGGIDVFPVAVVAVAAEAGRAVQVVANPEAVFTRLVVVFRQAGDDRGRIGATNAVADQFEESAVDDAVLGHGRLTVVLAERQLVVRVFIAAQTQEVATVPVFAGGGEHPRLDLGCVVVRSSLITDC